jgi:hypothetical protein
MKRSILKTVLLIFTALGLFALYLLACFPLLNTTVFRWEKDKGGQDSGSQVSGNTTDSANNSSDSKNDIFTFNFEKPVNPEISDYILVSITAKNSGPAIYPYGSIAVNLSEEKIGPLNNAAPGSEVDGIGNGDIYGAKEDMTLSENSTADSNAEIDSAASPGAYKIQERARIFIDGIRHNYYIAVGENKYWRHDWNLDGPTLKGQISSLEIEIPKIEGVDIQINSVSLNQRPVFAVDSHINYFFKNYFQLSYIDRYQTPAYIFLILFTAVFFVFSFLLKRTWSGAEGTKTDGFKSGDLGSPDLKERNSSVKTANENNIYAGNLNSNIQRNTGSTFQSNGLTDASNNFKTLALLIPLLLLIFFSFYFISNYIFTVKGYLDSYKQYIISGRLDETYYGFSDFEKFVTWVEEKVPQGQNIIVLVKGEPIYIMAQMAYGLYPRDIKFIDISSMSADEIANKIMSLNFAESPGKNGGDSANIEADKNNAETNNAGLTDSDGAQTYEYIVVLSETDREFLESVKVRLEYSYRENAGFLYKLILK